MAKNKLMFILFQVNILRSLVFQAPFEVGRCIIIMFSLINAPGNLDHVSELYTFPLHELLSHVLLFMSYIGQKEVNYRFSARLQNENRDFVLDYGISNRLEHCCSTLARHCNSDFHCEIGGGGTPSCSITAIEYMLSMQTILQCKSSKKMMTSVQFYSLMLAATVP
jgi:hypothetical protein